MHGCKINNIKNISNKWQILNLKLFKILKKKITNTHTHKNVLGCSLVLTLVSIQAHFAIECY